MLQMEQELTEAFLDKMGLMIRNDKRYFARRTRNGKSFIQQLADLGLTSVDEAWEQTLKLNSVHWYRGPEIDRDDPERGLVVWTFKMEINDLVTYIKLKDEEDVRGCVCISFHEDE